MALLWADGFDHYSTSTTGRENMLLGVYSAIDASWLPQTTKPRNSICSLATVSQTVTNGARRSFGTTKTEVGIGAAFWWTQLPAASTTVRPITISDAANAAQVQVVVQSSGALSVYRGIVASGTLIETTASQVIFGGQWNHIEIRWKAGTTTTATDGEVQVWVNETLVIDKTGGSTVRTVNTSNLEASQVTLGLNSENGVLPAYMDDAFAWDASGAYCASQIGDKDVLPYYYDADNGDDAGLAADWTASTASSWKEMVDDTAQDGDTTHVEAATALDELDLGLAAVPNTVDGIVAVVLVNMMRKTQAGASEVSADIYESTGPTGTANAAHVLTQSYAYYHDVVHRNPVDGTTAWTYTTLSAAKQKLTRTV